MSETLVVVPCYNEALRLDRQAFVRFSREAPTGIRCLFVNDGSTDGTAEVLRDICDAGNGRFDMLTLDRNAGKAEAVRRGILRGIETSCEHVGFWDADLSTPLDAIPRFRDLLENSPRLEMVFGARVKLLGRDIERRAMRHYTGRIFATLVSFSLGLAIYDTQCGAKMFRVTPGLRDLFDEPFLSRWIFDVEILARLIRQRHGADLPPVEEVIYEYPLETWRHRAGSKIRLTDFFRANVELARIHRRWLRGLRGNR